MLKQVVPERSVVARLGISDEPGKAGKYVRTILAFLKEAPAVGWAFKGAGAALKELSDAVDDDQLAERFESLLSSTSQSRDALRALSEIAVVLLVQQEEIRRSIAHQGLRTDALQLPEFAKAAALAAYRARVAQEYQYADHRGVEGATHGEHVASLELDSIYVLPHLVPEKEQFAMQERELSLLRQLLNDQDLLPQERTELEREYAAISGQRWVGTAKAHEAGISLDRAFVNHSRLIVIGSPGVGKSTLTRYVARSVALGADALRERLGLAEALVPVRVSLAEFAEARREKPGLELRDFIHAKVEKIGGVTLKLVVDEQVKAGSAFVLLDGVDEVPETAVRAGVVDAVDQFMSDTSCRVLVTSRPYGYIRAKGDLPHFILPNFSLQQVDEFVNKWHRACEERQHPKSPDYHVAAGEAAALLKEIRRNPKVTELATNPLMLVIASLIRSEKARLPEERVQLYHRAVNTLMDTWNQWRSRPSVDVGGVSLPLPKLVRVWAAIAEWTRRERNTGIVHREELKQQLVRILTELEFDEEDPEATAESYLRAAANRAGLLEERGPGVFAFWHDTFEEFLAAVELSTPVARTTLRLLPLRQDPRWREVILLAVGYLGVVRREQETATEVVRSLMEAQPEPMEAVFYSNLRLAAACVADDVGVQRSLAEDLIRRLAAVLVAMPYGPFVSSFTAVTRSLRNLRPSAATVEALQGLTMHELWEVRMEAARLLANVAPTNANALAACEGLLSDVHTDVRCHAAFGLAKAGRCGSAVIAALRSFTSESADIREALPFFAAPPAGFLSLLTASLEAEDLDVRKGAAKLLVLTHNRELVEKSIHGLFLLEGLEREEIVFIAETAASSAAVLETVLHALRDGDPVLQSRAATVLGEIRRADDVIVAALVDALGGDSPQVRFRAARSLGRLGRSDDFVVSALVRAIGGDAFEARSAAADALMRLARSEDEVIGTLAGVLGADNARQRFNAAVTLMRLGRTDDAVIGVLIDALEAGEPRTRNGAAFNLRFLDRPDEAVMGALTRALDADDPGVRFRAASSLRTLGRSNAAIVGVLVEALGADDPEVRAQALDSLANHGKSDDAIVGLAGALGMDDPGVRSSVAERLGRTGWSDDAIVDALVHSVGGDDDATVRTRAAKSLGSLGRPDDAVVHALRGALAAEEPELRYSAAASLISLGRSEDVEVSILVDALVADDFEVRESVARRLGEISQSDGAIVGALVDTLGRGGRYAGITALMSLARVDEPVVARLVGALRVSENPSALLFTLRRFAEEPHREPPSPSTSRPIEVVIIENLFKVVTDEPWEALAAFRRLRDKKNPTPDDGEALRSMVIRLPDDSAQQKTVRSFLFNWLYDISSETDEPAAEGPLRELRLKRSTSRPSRSGLAGIHKS